MAIQKIQICIIVGWFLFHVIQETIASSGEVNLTEYIFKNYHKNIRPQLSAQEPVKILTSVAFFQLLRIDEKEEVMTLNVWVRMKWNDTRLTWTPANFDNIQSLNVDVDNLWHPDIHLFNSVDSGTVFPSTSEGDLGFRAKISSDGFVEFSRPMILKLSCTMSIADYPYDTQNCTLIMGSWAHDITMMDMILAEDAVDMKSYRASEGWLVQNISAEKRYVTYECCNEPFTTLVYSMFIERSSLFYSINYVLPAVNLVFLSLLMFTVPPEVGKRMECGINLLLCVAVYLILINAKVPSTSLAFPVLSKFYACAIFILVIGMYCTTSVYAYYFHDPTGRGIYLMKHRFKVVVLYWMARIFLFPHGYRKGPDGKFVPVSSLQWGSESCNTDRQTPRLQKPKTVQNSLPGNEEQQYKIENKTKMMNQSERNDSGFQENDKPSSRGRSKSGENESRSSILKSSRITPEDEDIMNRRNIFAKKRTISETSRKVGRNGEKLKENLEGDKDQHRPRSVDSGKPSSPERDKSQNKDSISSTTMIKQQSTDSLWSTLSSNSSMSLPSHSPETPAHILLESPLPTGKRNMNSSMEIIEELLKEIASDDEGDEGFDAHSEEATLDVDDKFKEHEAKQKEGYCIDDLAEVIEEQSKRGMSDEEWRKAARVFNRLFIVILILGIIVCVIACFIV